MADTFIVPNTGFPNADEQTPDIRVTFAATASTVPLYSGFSAPCDQAIAFAETDFDRDEWGEITYRTTTDCLEPDDPNQNLVSMFFSIDEPSRPGVVLDVPTQLLLGGDFDHDGTEDVLAAGSDGSATHVRLLHFDGTWSYEAVAAPPSVERLASGRLRDPQRLEAVFAAADQVYLSPSLSEPPVPLGPSFGRLLAVGDFDADGLDDLLVAGSDGPSSVTLLLSR